MRELDSTALPLHGTHLIEASAGTGKTYNIVRIYLRLLLEKEYSVDQILVMTFTNAATAELRNRLSVFLREALDQWDTADDPVITTLRSRIEKKRADLLLNRAILQLDEATIFTIHSFCKRALSQQAFFSGMSFNANMDADSALLKDQATADWYRIISTQDFFGSIYESWPTPADFIAHWSRVIDSNDDLQRPVFVDLQPLLTNHATSWAGEQEQFLKLNKRTARSNAETLAAYDSAIEKLSLLESNPSTHNEIEFSTAELDKCFSTAKKKEAMPAAFALINQKILNQKIVKINLALDGIEFIKKHIDQDKGRLDQLDFNDLIIELKNALHGPNQNELRAVMLEQFPAALVDEFQDTDPDQYAILNAIYIDAPNAFVCMIGDPKQAIYGFRGGDVFAYLKARERVDQQWTMNTNYRSSAAVIDGYNRVFLQSEPEVNGDTFGFDIEYRKVLANPNAKNPDFSDAQQRNAVQWVHFEPDELPSRGLAKSFQSTIAAWCVQEVVKLISEVSHDETPVKPGDIAFLVRGYSEAELLKQTLSDAGIHSVYLSSRSNVFHTQEALELYQLLSGIWQFENDRAFVAALASQWISLSMAELESLQRDEHKWAFWQAQFEQWRNDWQQRGLMSMLLDILQNHFRATSDRLDRQLTNMLHLAEVLQKESGHYRLPDALLHWFARAREDVNSAEENVLRLESDDALVKIITMHGAKGLEYPIVFLPFVSYHGKPVKAPSVYRYHDRQQLNAKLSFLPSGEERSLAEEEDQAEMVRLFYVAATRASHRLYTCMAPFASYKDSALGLTLKQTKYDLEALQSVLAVKDDLSFLRVTENDIVRRAYQSHEDATVAMPAEFTGHIERDWWLSSFSSLTRHVGHSGHTTPDRDEDETMETPTDELPLRFRLTKGAEAGNLLHDALEHTDFEAPDFDELFSKSAERYSSLTDTFTQAEFSQWLGQMLQAPLTKGGCLADVSLAKSLRESEFYFPMAGSQISELGKLISLHRGSEYLLPDRNKLKGMMHGFIDLIFEHNGQYFVADYKSTYLGDRLEDYNQLNMQSSIHNSSYDVQYAIYSLALHRYLKIRIADYDPAQHFGGVYYFYLRGMHPDQETGVFYDPLSADILNQLDQIFANAYEADPA